MYSFSIWSISALLAFDPTLVSKAGGGGGGGGRGGGGGGGGESDLHK